jgi:2-polyprenyl-3-methyl-5-hydroxy-6-metoxy-1,4-benzoquinol methylase
VREQRLALGGAFTYGVCERCDLVQLFTKPADMGQYYQHYSYHPKAKGGKKTSVAKRGIVDRAYGRITAFLLKPMQPFVPPKDRKEKSILDVGCAKGGYLDKLRGLGFTDLHGIETSEEAVRNKAHPSLDIICSSLEDYRPRRKFDYVILNQVFEHFEDPNAMLAKLKGMLKDDGLLVMNFPNYVSFARRMFGARWPGYDAPRHYFTFSKKNLKLFAERHSMSIIRIRHISRPSQFTGSFQYIYNDKTGKKETLEGGRFRKSKLLDLMFFPPAYLLNILRSGDIIEIHLRKKKR